MDDNDYFFPTPTGRGIDLNEQLVRNKATTFFLRVRSDAMSGAGIREGDVVIVDRSLEPVSGKVVIASVNGELLIRRLERQGEHRARLLPEAQLAPIALENFSEKMIWGVVTFVIHHV
ncbi:LexA family protein [Flaviaesturariibacter aridisoli]|uniref:LexA family transcriptional regulator n=1 Tax=Flaviaesturariibacter aridisoli TaxID=2545761 RepID=A0A4V2WMW2_9BACT|nr:S24 family peptidase [Flaviaesturariibacter aridisoli]RYY64831.1 MAG: LexA family transcriptional regulator [Chitinophagaceae bacterium]TCZ73082.1 LexA family transcriptional regulator [Flaviaesturariibacter aridisoli]